MKLSITAALSVAAAALVMSTEAGPIKKIPLATVKEASGPHLTDSAKEESRWKLIELKGPHLVDDSVEEDSKWGTIIYGSSHGPFKGPHLVDDSAKEARHPIWYKGPHLIDDSVKEASGPHLVDSVKEESRRFPIEFKGPRFDDDSAKEARYDYGVKPLKGPRFDDDSVKEDRHIKVPIGPIKKASGPHLAD
ncbi:hypothetical protein BX616_004402 [Lobosporangium transversale]|uniref:Uncharacterized protein n=1 Tax=Lobosporangium transversale TaxID=64571 RepID=A0A1Y2GU39_9FUNG|nr:hypothetical protein BCR41DRAFT_395560 [Lobosporangium transversale]KAF9898160.1 hypothetical protein BX616_004402 [Lobosporangium transversale]ORZ18314.1 hypothetical protein BCR41DRAFT_395560 [Lobosporangium transversale]|eukprot:XP_021882109.1 hypothetical protein BCR41DRAFT_395560 [Lobosporangium transversale]